MRTLFIAAVLTATTLMACSLYFSEDPTQATPDDDTPAPAEIGRRPGRPHRDAGIAGVDANQGTNDAGVSADGGCCPGLDAGLFPDGGRY
jgi:hypothetical protein